MELFMMILSELVEKLSDASEKTDRVKFASLRNGRQRAISPSGYIEGHSLSIRSKCPKQFFNKLLEKGRPTQPARGAPDDL